MWDAPLYAEYILFPLINKEADLAVGQAKQSQAGNPTKNEKKY